LENVICPLICPRCSRKSGVRIRSNTDLTNFPLYCKQCKQETIINAKRGRIKIINEPDIEP
jgi:hypothetical protein